MARVYLYSRFLRLYHWLQALLVMSLLVTGFEVHGTIHWLGFERASDYHRVAAWSLLVLLALAWFWHITTGEWKQYIPSPLDRLLAMVRYYGLGIFKGEPHPFHKDRWHRHNPLQRMAYLSLHILIGPLLWISGLVYIAYPYWQRLGLDGLSLAPVALLHTAGAFLMLAFLCVHLYLALTTSEQTLGFLKGMVTGYEEVDNAQAGDPH
ncbi:MAG: cytochrome b/b6 domain-containing protein [Gammaproteobacteria bacterium]|nr:cytochrome b/b6 domain-containing protein [Gammaproteobacteria bacterium]MCB1923504.1 cytochrome b/b6 domain-containing protein [Gammaproteobacteria bacterium]